MIQIMYCIINKENMKTMRGEEERMREEIPSIAKHFKKQQFIPSLTAALFPPYL